MTKTRIAVLISGLLAVPAGVVALEQHSASSASEPKEVVAVEQTTIIAEPVAVVTEPQGTTVIAEPVAVERTVTIAEAPAPRAPSYTMTSLYVSSWPQGSFDSEYWKPLPGQAQWLEARDNQRQVMMASLGQGFPDGSANSEFSEKLLPSQVAHFDRAEQQRFARSQPPVVARVTPSSTESSAQAGSAEIAMADTSAIR